MKVNLVFYFFLYFFCAKMVLYHLFRGALDSLKEKQGYAFRSNATISFKRRHTLARIWDRMSQGTEQMAGVPERIRGGSARRG